jgi:membrane protease subunit (stomatin/prohibitin family)
MGILKSINDAIGGTFADQWKEIITAGKFSEQMVVAPGIKQESNNARGANDNGSVGVISNGSIVRVPENTAAFIFSQAGIEQIITKSGEFVYQDGESSIFNRNNSKTSEDDWSRIDNNDGKQGFFGDGLIKSIVNQTVDRVGFGGRAKTEKQISFVNLREIRGIKFGTPGPVLYHDNFYRADLEIIARGSYSVRVTDPTKFIREFLPVNVKFYSFSDAKVKSQISSEFIQSFMNAVNELSGQYKVSQLTSQGNEIAQAIIHDPANAGSWEERFGFKIVNVGIESIEFSADSKELVKKYTGDKMSLSAFEDISQSASNISAQQKVAEGIRDNGFGDVGGMFMGVNMAQMVNPVNGQMKQHNATKSEMTFDEQVEYLKKLKELLDMGILTQEEFDKKKREVLSL